ncbi:MAG: hypothetical protein GX141_01670 [Armatimonadetes bacterium]|jgi:hypothetical protein|nr:hypothetical protein [Armatimonadota bacterium]
MLIHAEIVQDSSPSQMTRYAGLFPYIDLACVLGLARESDPRIGVCGKQGWMDWQRVLSLALLNSTGAERVEDRRVRAII